MANSSRTQQRSSASRGRFGRTAMGDRPSSGRSLRASQGEPGAKGRFGLGASLGPSGYGRTTGSGRRMKSKAPVQKSGMGRAFSMLSGAMSGGAAKKATSRSAAKPAGFALLAGAAGLALKNREKLMGMVDRGRGSHADSTSGIYSDTTSAGMQSGVTSASTMPGDDGGTAGTAMSGTDSMRADDNMGSAPDDQDRLNENAP
jgi:hypothetical protein